MSLTAKSALVALLRGLAEVFARPAPPEAAATMTKHRLRKVIARSGLFDAEFYVRQVPTDDSAKADPLGHYIAIGEEAGRQPNRLFDPLWYRQRSIAECWRMASPLAHYILIGSRAGEAPGPFFDPASYLGANPDVAAAKIEPLKHFLTYGALEGRRGAGGPASQSWFGATDRHDLGEYRGGDGFSGNSVARSTFESVCPAPDRKMPPATLHIMHHAGGGTERAVAERLVAAPASERHLILMAAETASGLSISIVVPAQPRPLRFDFGISETVALIQALGPVGIGRAVVHQPLGLMSQLESLLSALRVPYDVTIHDYSLLCPRSSFVTTSGRYCREPDSAGCAVCLRMTPRASVESVDEWRSTGISIIRGAEKVECALEDVAARVRRYAPDARTVVAPLSDPDGRILCSPALAKEQILRVVVVGHCSTAKGGDFLLDCIEAAHHETAQISWTVIGSFGGADLVRARRMRGAVSVTGAYEWPRLNQLIADADPHLILFPQHCVETWSYALSEAMASGRMILAPDLGAFGERLRNVANAHLYGEGDSPMEVVRRITSLRTWYSDRKDALAAA